MAELVLEQIHLKNWTCFEEVHQEFPKSGGLILVQGVNTASSGAMLSVGSGKTSFGEAISRVLFDIPGRFSALKHYSTHKNGNTYIALQAQFRGKPLLVEAGYKYKALNKNGEALRFTYDGKQIECGTLQQTRLELQRLLQIPPLLASWTVHIDGDVIRFNQLSQAECVSLVMFGLNQPPWDDYYEISKKTLGQFRQTFAESKYKHTTAQTTVQDLEKQVEQAGITLAAAKKRYEEQCALIEEKKQKVMIEIKNIEQHVNEIESQKNKIKSQIKILESEFTQETHALEITIKEIQEKISVEETSLTRLTAALKAAGEELAHRKLEYNQLTKAQTNCPVCNRPMPKPDTRRISELQRLVTEASEAKTRLDQQEALQVRQLKALRQQLQTATAQLMQATKNNQIKQMSEKYELLDMKLAENNRLLQKYRAQLAELNQPVSTSDLDVATARYQDRINELVNARSILEQTAQQLEEDTHTLSVLEYLNQAFSPYGIPNMILNEALAPLNHEARRISHTLTGGTIEIRYSTVREMASGKDKAQLNIEVINSLGDRDLRGSSKGESGLTNFIVAETLAVVGQMARRVGYRWYDEVIPHQDTKVAQNIYAYMRDLALKHKILVFLVDHNPLAANYADRILRIEKLKRQEKSVSTVYSTATWETGSKSTD